MLLLLARLGPRAESPAQRIQSSAARTYRLAIDLQYGGSGCTRIQLSYQDAQARRGIAHVIEMNVGRVQAFSCPAGLVEVGVGLGLIYEAFRYHVDRVSTAASMHCCCE
jgi:tartrate dehydratase alpha subunit/fumarate hydratase class I-like protein